MRNAKLVLQVGLMASVQRQSPYTQGLMNASAVAILAIIKSKTGAFPPSTVVIEQYRPPIGKYVIGMLLIS